MTKAVYRYSVIPSETWLNIHGVQGVASSNPAAPTNSFKHLGHSSEWPFCFYCHMLCPTPTLPPQIIFARKFAKSLLKDEITTSHLLSWTAEN